MLQCTYNVFHKASESHISHKKVFNKFFVYEVGDLWRSVSFSLDCFIYILDSSNSTSFTFWSIQFAGSSRSKWTSIWTGNSNATSANGFRYCHKIFMKHPHTYTVIAWKYKRNISWKHKFMKKKNAISERTILLWKRRPVDNFTSIHFPFNKIRQTHSKQQLMTILQVSNVFFLNRSAIETEEKWFFIWYYRNIHVSKK